MAHKYNLTPQSVRKVRTSNRRIVTSIPVPQSIPILKQLARYEPLSMQGQPPVIWDRAKGIHVYDRWGNKWLDWSSGVLLTSTGHARPEIIRAIRKMTRKPLLATYVFPHEARAMLCRMLAKAAPKGLSKVFLLSTGSEAVECAIKLARTLGVRTGGNRKIVIVSFEGSFHGRTLGSQMAGGMPALKKWIVRPAPGFVQVPFPDGFRCADTRFSLFERALRKQGVKPDEVAGVLSETYQGIGPNFFPVKYARDLARWCRKHGAALIMDEVQAGFGRTGTYWGFEHYGITPDLICCGKGISSSLPISAVIGRPEIMNLYPPGSMTSTHSASPLPVVAAIENLKVLKKDRLVRNAARLGPVLKAGLERIQRKYPRNVGFAPARGLVGGLVMVKPGTREPDADTALAVNTKCLQKGLLMFAPVGLGGACIKIAPPLNTPRKALEEGLAVLEEAFEDVLGA